MQYFPFHNVTVVIRAENADTAYTALCQQLATIEGDWRFEEDEPSFCKQLPPIDVDCWTEEDETEYRSTAELFPEA